jgi:menaquinone-dependent protoporphyrinogen IX oxidase
MKVLIVFDSKHGTTEEVAGRVATAVKAGGGMPELLDLRKKGGSTASLSGYDAVALGAPFYMGSWSRRARAFAAAREAELAGKAFGVFAVGSNPALGDKAAIAALPPALAPAAASSAYFGGRFVIAKLGSFERFIVKMVAGKAEDTSTLDFSPLESFASALVKNAKGGAR